LALRQAQAVVPPAQYPRERQQEVSGGEPQFTQAWLDRTMQNLTAALENFAELLIGETNRVDEYRPQSLSGETLTIDVGQPDYECGEIITSILVTGPTAPTLSNVISGEGRVVTPGAGTAIAGTLGVAASGLYTVAWTVGIETAAATVPDNFKLLSGGVTLLDNSLNGIAVGDYPQQPQLVYLTAGQSVGVYAVSAEATATYAADLTVTPYNENVPFTFQLGSRVWQLTLPPTGVLVIAPVQMTVSRRDTRQLTASVGGNWSFELMGYADIGRRGHI
jgi:hypothetical protein